jgi:hypothetical protein
MALEQIALSHRLKPYYFRSNAKTMAFRLKLNISREFFSSLPSTITFKERRKSIVANYSFLGDLTTTLK